MEHAVSVERQHERSEIWARQNRRLEEFLTPDNQQELEDGDLNKIMDRDLYKATKKGDVEKFIDAIEKVYDSRKLALSQIFEQVTPSGNSLLHVAASSGSDDVMELILIHFPHTKALKNSSEDTPLHVAVRDKRFNTIEKLIRRETNWEIIYWKNKDGKSPLYLAVEKCELWHRKDCKAVEWEIFQLLLQEFARDEAYAVKILGMSPILAAIKKENTDILKEIIDRLPKLLYVRNEDGGTSLHAAASVGYGDAIGLLLEKCPYLALQTDDKGSYPIHIACEAGHLSTMERLLKDTWPDLAEIKNKKGQNILHVAAKVGKIAAVRLLKNCTKFEKLINSTDGDGNTPLHLATMHIHCEVMGSLTKDKGIDLQLQNNDGFTALDVATESRRFSTTNPALLGRKILIVAGLKRREGRDTLSPKEEVNKAKISSSTEWIKEQVNILLLVATLVASVTFTAGLTLPGGYNAPSDPSPGTPTMLHDRMFRVFVIANVLAMYSSILAVVVLLWGLNGDFFVAELAYHLAGLLLLMALTGMSVTFLAAVTIAVSKLAWLGILVLYLGVFYVAMIVVVLAAFIFTSSKATMTIVVCYYLMVSTIVRCVKLCVSVFDFIIVTVPALLVALCLLLVDRVHRCIIRLRESFQEVR